jgi:hypothetical protein
MLRKEIYELPQFVLVLSKFIFSLLTILDVRTRRVPPSDVSFLIDERVVPDKKPPVFTAFPANPLLVFERNRARETFLLLFAKFFNVFWMKHALPEVIGAHFVQRQTRVVKCRAVCIDGFPIPIQDNNCLCDRIDHATKLFFILKKLGLRA